MTTRAGQLASRQWLAENEPVMWTTAPLAIEACLEGMVCSVCGKPAVAEVRMGMLRSAYCGNELESLGLICIAWAQYGAT